MKSKSIKILAMATAVTFSVLPLTRAFAQDSVAGQQMHESGESMDNAGSNTSTAVKHAYHASVDQMSDATLTTKVKAALVNDHRAHAFSIHVESDHGMVTIDGAVASSANARHIQKVVASVHGVRGVDNKLTWPRS
ncbi:MAG: BON domain-containing protein [Candidatus Binataceae bacterium]|nr:BON domain-containing protein [Candidatus Binataceae bacterium]